LLKATKEEVIPVMTILCNEVWEKVKWTREGKRSIFIPLPKKGDVRECSNNRTIALIPHASKILLRIIQKRLEPYIEREMPVEQAGFRKERGLRDQIANVRWILERTRERNKPVYLCFIDYAKAFDSVEHSKMWNSMRNMGIPEHLIGLIRNLYTEQEAKGHVEQGATDWFPVQKGVRQGCILSPGLFNLYSEHIIRTAGLEDIEASVKIGGRKINNLRYADDTTLLAENKDDMGQLMKRVKISSEKAGLKLNIKKTRVMSIGDQGNILVDGEEIRTVTSYKFLGALITNDGYTRIHDDMKRRIMLGKAAMAKLTKIMKDSGFSTNKS
jgi:hypothetical protein